MRRLHQTLGTSPQMASVPAGLEQAALRRVRAALAAEDTATGGRWMQGVWWVSMPLAATIALVLAWRLGPGGSPSSTPGERTASTPASTASGRIEVATAGGAPSGVEPVGDRMEGERSGRSAVPPPQLAETLDLYLDLPLLENLEKLQNFEAIRTVEDGTGEDSRGRQG